MYRTYSIPNLQERKPVTLAVTLKTDDREQLLLLLTLTTSV